MIDFFLEVDNLLLTIFLVFIIFYKGRDRRYETEKAIE